jgi:uncharacterized LabA/DUF88 family protein
MPTKVAVLIDGGFALKKLFQKLGRKHPTAEQVHEFARKCVVREEDLFRIYYYDCLPFDGTRQNPISKAQTNFRKTPTYHRQAALIDALSKMRHVAFRRGEISFNGWALTRNAAEDIFKNPRNVKDSDLSPNLGQKQVDMKIGLDIAWLSSKRIVERLIIVAGDSDLVPAMKFARREGLQVAMVTMGHKMTKESLTIHADEMRDVQYP